MNLIRMKRNLSPIKLEIQGIFKSIVQVLIVFAPFLAVHAQFFERLSNPTILVNLTHPPMSGFKINKVTFGPPAGRYADRTQRRLLFQEDPAQGDRDAGR